VFKIDNFKIKFSEKGIMSCAGSIRGAIAFGLAISIDTKNKSNYEVLVSSTLILVFFTTIVFGALMPFFIKFFKSFDQENNSQDKHEEAHNESLYSFLHPNFTEE
jgi:NhaP-type Na+/H+ or K+/H+ antiporter